MRSRLRWLVLLFPVLTAGCSALSVLDDASRPLEIYELQAPRLQGATSRRSIELVVEEPSASGALAVERIMIRPAPLQAQYLPGVRWADPAPEMIQTLLVRTLTETGTLGSVGRRPVGTIGDYAVLSELTDFQAETIEGDGGATVRVRLSMRVLRERDSTVVATRIFSVSEPTPTTDPDAVVAAFDRATTRFLTDAVPWVLSLTR